MSTKTTQKSWKRSLYNPKILKNFIFLITKKKIEENALKKDFSSILLTLEISVSYVLIRIECLLNFYKKIK